MYIHSIEAFLFIVAWGCEECAVLVVLLLLGESVILDGLMFDGDRTIDIVQAA